METPTFMLLHVSPAVCVDRRILQGPAAGGPAGPHQSHGRTALATPAPAALLWPLFGLYAAQRNPCDASAAPLAPSKEALVVEMRARFDDLRCLLRLCVHVPERLRPAPALGAGDRAMRGGALTDSFKGDQHRFGDGPFCSCPRPTIIRALPHLTRYPPT